MDKTNKSAIYESKAPTKKANFLSYFNNLFDFQKIQV